MKKLSLILTVITIGIVAVAFSQTNSQVNTREEVKQYFDKNIFPALEKQQELYIKKLTDSEKEELNTLKETINQRRNNSSTRHTSGNNTMKKPVRSEMQGKIKKITDAHPKLNDSYKKFIDNNMQTWVTDIKAIHDKNNIEPMRNKNNKTGLDIFFERVSNPDWLLLWDPLNPRIAQSMAVRQTKDIKNNRRASVDRKRNPELRADIKAFVGEIIIPVIAAERTAFDKLLNDDEKKIVETTRQKIQVRKVMFKSWYESEDFAPGQRAKDPNFDGMRTDMQNSMAEVRDIAIAHSSEIREYTNKIRSHADEWKKEIRSIAETNTRDSEQILRMVKQHVRKLNTPIAFLLFNPNKDMESDFFELEEEIKVIVYPNPIIHSATIAVIGAAGKNIQVTLYTKEGETLNKLYSGLNNDQRLEIALNSTELNNDVYIIKVVADDIEISRKIVVRQ